jgi:two-component system OmpR family sensor kinase
MFSSLRFRLWLTYALVVGVVIAIAGSTIAIYLLRNPSIDRRELQRLRLVSNLIIQRSQIFNLSPDSFSDTQKPAAERLQGVVERADNASGVRVAVFSSSGELMADSRAGQVASFPDWPVLSRRTPGVVSIFRDQAGKQWLYTISPMESGDYLLVAAPRPRFPAVNVLRDELLLPFIRGAALALILSLLVAIWIAHWITRPLERLADAARSASVGKIHPIQLGGPDEVQSVAKAFNEMGERVQASQRSQRDFIANVSHDLKTPLTSIQGFAQAIKDGTVDDPAAARQAADVIFQEAERMHRMVLDLLELARLDSGVVGYEYTKIDLGKLLENVVQKFALQAQQAQVDLKLMFSYASIGGSTSDILPAITGDADRLAQVFSNLVDNALKYTPAGGQVSLTARPVDGWVEVWVSDTGSGLPSEELERVFERFYQTDKSRSGTGRRGVGLGLAIAREIVQAHGGTISAYNRAQAEIIASPDPGLQNVGQSGSLTQTVLSDNGSVFVVRLPVGRSSDDRRPPELPVAKS